MRQCAGIAVEGVGSALGDPLVEDHRGDGQPVVRFPQQAYPGAEQFGIVDAPVIFGNRLAGDIAADRAGRRPAGRTEILRHREGAGRQHDAVDPAAGIGLRPDDAQSRGAVGEGDVDHGVFAMLKPPPSVPDRIVWALASILVRSGWLVMILIVPPSEPEP